MRIWRGFSIRDKKQKFSLFQSLSKFLIALPRENEIAAVACRLLRKDAQKREF